MAGSTQVIVPCPHCGKKYNVGGLKKDVSIRCKRCGSSVSFKATETAALRPPVGLPPSGAEGGLVAGALTAGGDEGAEGITCRGCEVALDVSGIGAGIQVKCGECGCLQVVPEVVAPSSEKRRSNPAIRTSEPELALALKESVQCKGCDALWYLDEIDPPSKGLYVCKRCGRTIPAPSSGPAVAPATRPRPKTKKSIRVPAAEEPQAHAGKKSMRKKKVTHKTTGEVPTLQAVEAAMATLSAADRAALVDLLAAGKKDRAVLKLYPLCNRSMALARRVADGLHSGLEEAAPVASGTEPEAKKAEGEPPREEPGFFDGLARKGRLVRFNMLYKLGSWQKIVEIGDRVIEAEPENWRLYFQLGEAYANLARYEEAVARFESVLRFEPNELETWRYLADLNVRLERHDAAVAALETLMRLEPHTTKPLSRLREVHRLRGDLAAEKQALEALCDREPGRIDHRRDVVLLLVKEGKAAAAVEHVRQVLRLDSPPFSVTLDLLECVRAVDRKAAGLYELAVEIETELGRPYRAIKALHALIALEPERPEHYRHLARLYLAEGMERGARDALRKAGDPESLGPDLLFRLAELDIRLGDPEAGKQLLTVGLERYEEERFARSLVSLLLKGGHHAEALEHLARAKETYQDAIWVTEELRRAQAMALDARIERLEKASPRDPKDAVELASTYLEHGRPGKAIDVLQSIAAKEGVHDEVLTMLRALVAHGLDSPEMVASVRDLYLELDETGHAIELLERASVRSPDLLLSLGRLYVGARDLEKAGATLLALEDAPGPLLADVVRLGEDILASDIDFPYLHRSVALAHLRRGSKEEAACSFENYLAQVPEDAETRERLAELLLDLGRGRDASSQYEMLLQSGMASGSTYRVLGRLAMEGGRPADAYEHLRQAMRHDPADLAARQLLEEVECQILDAEIRDLEERLVSKPKDDLLRDRLVRRLVRRGMTDVEGIGRLRAALPPGSDAAPLYFRSAAEFLKQHHKMRLAADYLERLLEAAAAAGDVETQKQVLYEMGILGESTGDLYRAKRAFARIFEIDPDWRDVLARLESLSRGDVYAPVTEPLLPAFDLEKLHSVTPDDEPPLADIRLSHIDLSWDEIFEETPTEPPLAPQDVGPPLPAMAFRTQGDPLSTSLAERKTEEFHLSDLEPHDSGLRRKLREKQTDEFDAM